MSNVLVSAVMQLDKESAPLTRALKIIDSVHSDGVLPLIRVSASYEGNFNGMYVGSGP